LTIDNFLEPLSCIMIENHMKSYLLCSVVVVLALLLSTQGFSQIDQSSLLSATSVGTTTSNYYFARSNELTIMVNVMGFVQRPGRYEISNTIDLINLLSLAGGPTPDGSLSDVKITRLVNTGSRYERKQFRLDLGELPKVSSAELVLQPGDIIEVERTGWSNFRDTFTLAVSVVALTSTVVSIIAITRK